MYVSNTAVALTITKKEAPFTDKASMLRWVDACLNYNTNNASVVVEPLNIKLAELAKACSVLTLLFDAVNTLLDGSGALESRPLQRGLQAASGHRSCFEGDKKHGFLLLRKVCRS